MYDEKTNVCEPLLTHRQRNDGTKTRKADNSGTKARPWGAPLARGRPACCPGGARCKGGVTSSLARGWNTRTSRLDSVMAVQLATEPSPWREQPLVHPFRPRGKADVKQVRVGRPQVRSLPGGRLQGPALASRRVIAEKLCPERDHTLSRRPPRWNGCTNHLTIRGIPRLKLLRNGRPTTATASGPLVLHGRFGGQKGKRGRPAQPRVSDVEALRK